MEIKTSLKHRHQPILVLVSVLLILALMLNFAPVNAMRMSSADKLIDQQSTDLFIQATGQLLPPKNLIATELGSTLETAAKLVKLSWEPSSGAVQYNIYRSLTQSDYNTTPLASITASSPYAPLVYNDYDFGEGTDYHYYVVTAVDSDGVESNFSNEVMALTHYKIFWVGTVRPQRATNYNGIRNQITPLVITNPSSSIRIDGEAHIIGRTGGTLPEPDLIGQLGFGPAASGPNSDIPVDLTKWTNWIDAKFDGLGIYPGSGHSRYIVNFFP